LGFLEQPVAKSGGMWMIGEFLKRYHVIGVFERQGDIERCHQAPGGDITLGERVLAKEFGVSYMTIRKAVENLVTQSILYKIPARGTYVDQRGTVKRMVNRS
jgi:hypothetical protein